MCLGAYGIVVATCYWAYPRLLPKFQELFVDFYPPEEAVWFMATSVVEPFLVRITTSLRMGVIMSTPLWMWQLLAFVLPALRKKEKIALITTILLGTILGIAGGLFAYMMLLPSALHWLAKQDNQYAGIRWMLQYQTSIILVEQFLLAGLVSFQIPIVLGWLLRTNLLMWSLVFRSGRYVVIGILLISALLTPPDIISQILLAIPMILLFYTTLIVAWFFGWGEEESDRSKLV